MIHDLSHAVRRLLARPAFTVVAVVCLAVGMGAAIAVFSLANSLLLAPPPGLGSMRGLVTLTPRPVALTAFGGQEVALPLSYPHFRDYQQIESFEELVAFQSLPLELELPEQSVRVEGQLVTPGYFRALGLRAVLGEARVSEEATGTTVVVSHGFWQRRLGGEAGVIGRTLSLNGQLFLVAGVLPESFAGTLLDQPAEVWLPLPSAPRVMPGMNAEKLAETQHRWLFHFFARLVPEADLALVRGQLERVAEQIVETLPADELPPRLTVSRGIGLQPAQREATGEPVLLLAGLVGLLVLLVCANLAAWLLAQAVDRRGEWGLRQALGATRGQVIRLQLLETLILASVGGLGAWLVALWLRGGLEGMAAGRLLPQLSAISVDGRLIAFALAMVLLTGLATGLVPALWSARLEVPRFGQQPSLPGRLRGQEALVVVQVALSLLLVASAALLISSWRNLARVDPGFDPEGVVNVRLDLSLRETPAPEGRAFFLALLERLRSRPEVRSAALAQTVPLAGFASRGTISPVLPDAAEAAAGPPVLIPLNPVSAGYFRTLGIRLVAGRDFAAEDVEGGQRVVILNEPAAAELFGTGEVIDRTVRMGSQVHRIVGIVAGVRSRGLAEDSPAAIYVPLTQHYAPSLTLHLKSSEAPSALLSVVRSAMAELGMRVPLFQVALYSQEVKGAMAQTRLLSTLVGGFGVAALLVAALGLYGVLMFTVSRRGREMGIRQAVGASRGSLLFLVLRRGVILVAGGLLLGLGGAWATGRWLGGFLFGVTPLQPEVWALCSLFLLLVGIAASAVPARRAARVDPATAMREG